jgi:hypothetical protein
VVTAMLLSLMPTGVPTSGLASASVTSWDSLLLPRDIKRLMHPPIFFTFCKTFDLDVLGFILEPGGGGLVLVHSILSALGSVWFTESVCDMTASVLTWTATSSRHRSKVSIFEGKAGVDVGNNTRRGDAAVDIIEDVHYRDKEGDRDVQTM